jgi:uncharacterized protein YndB with AHSA1/START domain
MENQEITVQATVKAPVEKVWKCWTTPEDIVEWNSASPEWHTPSAANNLKPGGVFTFRMEAKDGSMGFDFSGEYDQVKEHELISYRMEDARKVKVVFEAKGDETIVTETFDPENQNPVEMQKGGWQAILDNFKNYTENQ